MAYIGIGYSGDKPDILRNLLSQHMSWLKGDRVPRLFGDAFIVLYDTDTIIFSPFYHYRRPFKIADN